MLPRRDVALTALHADLTAAFVIERPPCCDRPLTAAVLGYEPILLVANGSTPEQAFPKREHMRTVFRMDPADGFRVSQFGYGITGELLHCGIRKYQTSIHVVRQHHLA